MTTEDENIISIFLQAASLWPNNTALIHDQQNITYANLLQDVQRVAQKLQLKGIGKGDKVLVAVPMSIDLYRVVLAMLYIGAVPVFLDAWVGRKRMAECMATVHCKALVAGTKILWLAWLFKSLRTIPVRVSPHRLQTSEDRLLKRIPTSGEDTALVTFTTGSTGIPKAARRTHSSLRAQLEALRPLLPQGQDTSFTMLPIVVLINIGMGKTTVLPPANYKMKKPASINYLHAGLLANKVSTLIVSPSVMQLLSNESPLPNVNNIITGGGPVYPAMAQKVAGTYRTAKATVVYGSTEAEPISHAELDLVAQASDRTLATLGLPVGKPDRASTVSIIRITDTPIIPVDEGDWAQHLLPPGEVGEIIVSGPHVLREYIDNEPAVARNKIKVNNIVWHRTGDAGLLDEHGQLYLRGRCNEVFDWKGEAHYPMIASCRLCAITGLQDAAITMWQNVPVLIIPEQTSVSDSDLKKALSIISLPEARIVRVSHIPKDPRHLTKVDWDKLHKMLR
jgi:acyl-CoA synthetase (AMP-forming)/AMP-acid ligase II